MLAKMKILILFVPILILSFACNDDSASEANKEKIQFNKKLHYMISELDNTMNQLRGDILQSQVDSNYQKLDYLIKLEDHRHNLTKLLNKIRFVLLHSWNEYKDEVKQELAKAKETLKRSSYFE